MRGRIVLHLLARTKFIAARTMLFFILPQIKTSHDSGEGTVGDTAAVLVLEDLLNPDCIALSEFKYLLDGGRKFLIRGWSQRSLLPLSPDDPSDGIAREFEDLADLPNGHCPLIQTQDGKVCLLRDLHDKTSLCRFQVS